MFKKFICPEKSQHLSLSTVILNVVKDPRLHFHGFRLGHRSIPNCTLALFVLALSHPCSLAQEPGAEPVGPHTLPWQLVDPSQPNIGPRRIEKWDTLSLEGGDLRPDSPVMEQTDDFPEFTRELVRVQWRDADPIDLYIVRPKGVSRPPMVLYLYGYPREAVRFLDMNFCKTVTKNGYAAIGFSSMLTGQRYHDVPMKEWFVSDLQRSLVGTTHDVQMVLNYLAGRGDFNMLRVGIFGEGSGGTIALLAASTDPRIKAVDVLDPWGDWPSWLSGSRVVPQSERADYTSPDFLKGIAPLDPLVVLPRLISTRLRVQQSLWDSGAIPTASRGRIAASVPAGAQLAQYRDISDYSEKVGTNGKMLDWMYASLAPAANRSAVNPSTVAHQARHP
jgi:hypothetical protein